MLDGGAGRLRGAVLVVTSACNLRCRYCLQDRHPALRMSDETARLALDRLFSSRPRKVEIAFYGGEPLLAFDLVRRTIEEAERRRPPGCRLLFELSTNGLLLDMGKAAFLAAHGVDTQVSFDGCRAAQQLRAPGTFEALSHRLDDLRRYSPDFYRRCLEVALIVTPENLHVLAASVKELLSRKVPRISLGPVMGARVKWDGSQEAELDRQLRLVYRTCRSLYERSGRVPVTLFRRGLGRPVAPKRGAMCGIGRGHSITVDVDGEVSACQLLARSVGTFSGPGLRRWVEPLRVGRLDEPDLGTLLERFRSEVRRSPLFTQSDRKHSGGRQCTNCRYRASCHICPMAIAHAGEDPHLVPEFLCAFRRASLKYRERFPAQLDIPA